LSPRPAKRGEVRERVRERGPTRARTAAILLIAIASTITSCAASSAPDACILIADTTFVSVNQMECGLGPDGVVTRCNWRVAFTASAYTWSHSDVVESGAYSCDGATIIATRAAASTTPLLGRLDPQTGQLTWDGATYVAQ
jgi:hypothetical protein